MGRGKLAIDSVVSSHKCCNADSARTYGPASSLFRRLQSRPATAACPGWPSSTSPASSTPSPRPAPRRPASPACQRVPFGLRAGGHRVSALSRRRHDPGRLPGSPRRRPRLQPHTLVPLVNPVPKPSYPPGTGNPTRSSGLIDHQKRQERSHWSNRAIVFRFRPFRLSIHTGVFCPTRESDGWSTLIDELHTSTPTASDLNPPACNKLLLNSLISREVPAEALLPQ